MQHLIAIPEVKDAIKKDGSKIKLRFAADGRRTSKRIEARTNARPSLENLRPDPNGCTIALGATRSPSADLVPKTLRQMT